VAKLLGKNKSRGEERTQRFIKRVLPKL